MVEGPLSPQNYPLHGGSGPPSNIWFLQSTRVHNPNGISIGSAVFAGLTVVTDQQPCYSVCKNKPHLRVQYYDAI